MFNDSVQTDEIIYLVMSDGSVYLSTTDEDYAHTILEKLERSNIEYAEDCCGMTEEEAPLTVNYLAGREGDHVYLEEIYEGLEYFEDNEEYETSEGDFITEADITDNFAVPGESELDDNELDF